jgi:hypothetical protein
MMDKEIDELILYLLGGGRERTKLEAGILLLSRLRDENVELKNKMRDDCIVYDQIAEDDSKTIQQLVAALQKCADHLETATDIMVDEGIIEEEDDGQEEREWIAEVRAMIAVARKES